MAARVHSESARRVSGCVTALLREQPFFGSLALRLPIRADASRETVASDGREIRYSPRWIADTDAHVIETAMARVVLACALKHHTRRGARDPERWQRASQLVTHGLLRDAGFTLPPDAEAWDGISVEQAYDRLPEPDPDDGDGDGNAPSGGGDAGAPDSPPSTDPGGDDDSGGSDDGAGDGDPQDGDGQETGADAPPSCDPGGTGEVMDAPAGGGQGGAAPSPADIAAEEQAWDEAMHQAASLAKAQGRMPGAVEETVRGAHTSTVDWRTLLRRYMTDATKRDYSWSLPNRRFIDSGLYLPSNRSEGIDTIAVIVDTSGSLPAGTLAEFWAEIREIATELQPERVILLQVDAAVQDAAEYATADLPDEIAIRGRGGTDFRPGFAWLEEHDIQPGVCKHLAHTRERRCEALSPACGAVEVEAVVLPVGQDVLDPTDRLVGAVPPPAVIRKVGYRNAPLGRLGLQRLATLQIVQHQVVPGLDIPGVRLRRAQLREQRTDLPLDAAVQDPKRGLQAELRGRGLLAHESKGFRDLGFSGALAWEGKPGSDRGAKLRLTQTLGGSSSGGADAPLARGTLEGLAANDNGAGGNDELKSRRLELKFGYGLSAFGDRFTWTPEAGVGLSDTGRNYSLGWRLVRGGSGGDGGSFELSFEARRRESANDDTPPEHEVGLRLSARW